MAEVDTRDPRLAADLFDPDFLAANGEGLMLDFFAGTDDEAVADKLCQVWRDQFDRENRAADQWMQQVRTGVVLFLEALARECGRRQALHPLIALRAQTGTVAELKALRRELAPTVVSDGDAEDRYLAWLVTRNTYLDARGTLQTQRQVQLRLDDIFVNLSASESSTIESDRAELDHRESDGRVARPHVPRFPLAEAIHHSQRVAILGDPGGGKSTLVRYLALQHARAIQAGLDRADHDLGPVRLPILVRVASLVEQREWRTQSLLKTIAAALGASECPEVGLLEAFELRLESGTAIVLFDGLDEVSDADDRRAVVGKIEAFIDRFHGAGNNFVVTSRIAGYRSASMDGSVRHLVIRNMSTAEQKQFLSKWCLSVEDAQTPDLPEVERQRVAQREIDAIEQAIAGSPGVAALAVNPLLLRILALIHRTGARLPEKRVELYKLAADTLAQTWRLAQGVPESELVKEQFLTKLLSHLGFWMHSTQPSGTAPYDAVFAVLAEEWCQIQHVDWDPENPSDNVTEQVGAFLERVRVQTGLFVERSPGQFGFMHLTFEEYYAARRLIRKPRTAAAQIRNHLHDPRWREPILLCLGFKGLDFPDEASDLVRAAVLGLPDQDDEDAGIGPSRFEEYLHRDLAFALACIADGIPVDARTRADVVAAGVEQLEAMVDSGLSVAFMDEFVQPLRVIAASPDVAYDVLGELKSQVAKNDVESPKALGALTLLCPEVEAFGVASNIYTDDRNLIELRQSAFLIMGRVGRSVPNEWRRMVFDVVISTDEYFLSDALYFLDEVITFGSDLSDIDVAVWRLATTAGVFQNIARQALFDSPINETAPNLVSLLIETVDADTSPPRDMSNALIALSSVSSRRAFEAIARRYVALDSGDNLRIDAIYAMQWAYPKVASELGRITDFIPEDELSLFEHIDIADRGDEGSAAEVAALRERIAEAESDGELAFYIECLASVQDPSEWWREVRGRVDEFGTYSRVAHAQVAPAGLTVDEVARIAQDPEPDVRRYAARPVNVVPQTNEVRGLLAGLLSDESPQVRASAARTSAWLMRLDGADWVERLLGDPETEVRSAAWQRLTADNPAVTIKHVRRSLADDASVEERSGALRWLRASDAVAVPDDLRAELANVLPPDLEARRDRSLHYSCLAFAQACAIVGDFERLDSFMESVGPSLGAFPFQAMMDLAIQVHPDPVVPLTYLLRQAQSMPDDVRATRLACRWAEGVVAERPDYREPIVEFFVSEGTDLLASENGVVKQSALSALTRMVALDVD